jgi:hypothetical protein
MRSGLVSVDVANRLRFHLTQKWALAPTDRGVHKDIKIHMYDTPRTHTYKTGGLVVLLVVRGLIDTSKASGLEPGVSMQTATPSVSVKNLASTGTTTRVSERSFTRKLLLR